MDTPVLRPFLAFSVMWNEAQTTAEQITVSTNYATSTTIGQIDYSKR